MPKRHDPVKHFGQILIKPSAHKKVSVGVPKGFKQPTPSMKSPNAVMKTPKLPGC